MCPPQIHTSIMEVLGVHRVEMRDAEAAEGYVKEFTRHSDDVLLNLNELRRRKILTDATLVIGDVHLRAHCAVLVACRLVQNPKKCLQGFNFSCTFLTFFLCMMHLSWPPLDSLVFCCFYLTLSCFPIVASFLFSSHLKQYSQFQ